jgi:hypothetical protein
MTTTAIGAQGAIKKPARRDYGKDTNGKKRPGVTTVIGAILAKPALMFWAAKEAAKAAAQFILDGASFDEAVERARKAHVTVRDAAADAGTLAHIYVEQYLRTGALPPEDLFNEEDETQKKARSAFERFRAWWPTSGYEVVHLELPLIDDAAEFGGTIDQVLRRKSDGALIVGDLKTGKSIYDDVVFQLGAYALLLDKHGMRVDSGLIIHSPVDFTNDDGELVVGKLSAVEVGMKQLEIGAKAFSSLLYVYKSLPHLDLKLSGKGGVP